MFCLVKKIWAGVDWNGRGKVLAEAGEDEEIVYVRIEAEELDRARQGIPVSGQRRFDVYGNIALFPD